MKLDLISAFRRAVIELAIVFIAIIFVRKELYLQPNWLVLDWQQMSVCALAFVDGFVGSMSQPGNFTSPFRKKVLKWIMPLALFFYIACAALSRKLHVLEASEEMRIFGLLLSVIGVGLYIWSRRTAMAAVIMTGAFSDQKSDAPEAEEVSRAQAQLQGATDQPFVARGPWLKIRYPDRSALILVLAGQALLLGSWLPWFALPGVLIGMKWEIADIESFRISQFGDRYIEYRQHSWALVPFLF